MKLLRVIEDHPTRLMARVEDLRPQVGLDPADASKDADLAVAIARAGAMATGPEGLDRIPWRRRAEWRLAGAMGNVLSAAWPIEEIVGLTYAGTAVTLSLEVLGDRRNVIKPVDGELAQPCYIDTRAFGDPQLPYLLDLIAGWLLPGEVSAWEDTTAYALGSWVSSDVAGDPLRYRATVAGSSAGAAPAWPALGETVVDGTVTWQARAATEQPLGVTLAVLLTAAELHHSPGALGAPAGIASETTDGHRIAYTASGPKALPAAAQTLLAGHR